MGAAIDTTLRGNPIIGQAHEPAKPHHVSNSRMHKSKQAPVITSAQEPHPQIQLTPPQELAAITSFLASLPQNVIPSSVDPAKPIDPSLVLDFDPSSPKAAEEVEEMMRDVWTRNPVVLYGKVRIFLVSPTFELD